MAISAMLPDGSIGNGIGDLDRWRGRAHGR